MASSIQPLAKVRGGQRQARRLPLEHILFRTAGGAAAAAAAGALAASSAHTRVLLRRPFGLPSSGAQLFLAGRAVMSLARRRWQCQPRVAGAAAQLHLLRPRAQWHHTTQLAAPRTGCL